MSDFEDEIEQLKREIAILEGRKNQISTYSFSKIKFSDLKKILTIKRAYKNDIFNIWFDNNIKILDEDIEFLSNIIDKFSFLV